MSSDNVTPDLLIALAAAQKDVGHLRRDARNAYGGYNYVSSETMIAEARDALHKNGLVFIPACVALSAHPVSGHALTLLARVYHPASNGSLSISFDSSVHQSKGQGLDKSDASAHTFLLNYMLRDLLLVPRVDKDVEVDARDDSGYDPSNKAQPATADLGSLDASSFIERMRKCNTVDELQKVAGQAKNALGQATARSTLTETYNLELARLKK